MPKTVDWPHSFFIHYQTPDGRNVAQFTPSLQCIKCLQQKTLAAKPYEHIFSTLKCCKPSNNSTHLTAAFSPQTRQASSRNRKHSGFTARARDDGWQTGNGKSFAQCSRQITTLAPCPYHSVFTGHMLFLMPNQIKALCK